MEKVVNCMYWWKRSTRTHVQTYASRGTHTHDWRLFCIHIRIQEDCEGETHSSETVSSAKHESDRLTVQWNLSIITLN